MKRLGWLAILSLVLSLVSSGAAEVESHRATILGHPSTRFADPLFSVADLRARFRTPQLRADMESVLRKWGWTGDPQDMFAAAATAEVADIKIPIGEVMPFMSTRRSGLPICLRNVTWAGKEPAPAYAFLFSSRGQRYRCVTPKACSNFFVVDLGPEPRHEVGIDCTVTNEVLMGRRFETCLTVRNLGNVTEPSTTVTLPIPARTTLSASSDGATATAEAVTWVLKDIKAGETASVCATFKTQEPGVIYLRPEATDGNSGMARGSCEIMVLGVSALLLEKADDPDPVPVGETTTYTVKVTNQGTADDTEVKVVVEFPEEIDPVTASNGGQINGKTVTFPDYARLEPKEAFQYTIVAKGVKVGDARVTFIRTSKDIPAPTMAEESTRIY